MNPYKDWYSTASLGNAQEHFSTHQQNCFLKQSNSPVIQLSNLGHLPLVVQLCLPERVWLFFSLSLSQTLNSCRQQNKRYSFSLVFCRLNKLSSLILSSYSMFQSSDQWTFSRFILICPMSSQSKKTKTGYSTLWWCVFFIKEFFEWLVPISLQMSGFTLGYLLPLLVINRSPNPAPFSRNPYVNLSSKQPPAHHPT